MESGEYLTVDDERGKLFVGGLSWDTTYASLLKYFSQYGQVIDCVVMKNSETGKSRGFGFVKFSDPAVLDVVLLNAPHWIDGRQVDPKVCNPRSMNQGGKSTENSKRKIFVGGLPPSCDEAQLKEVFRKFGNVEEATIMYDQERNRSRGFGFLTFESEAGVDRVCSEHYIVINGKQVECKRAEPRAIKSVADTGRSAPTLLPGQQPITVIQGQTGATAAITGLTNGHPQGALGGSPQTLIPSPVGASMQHPGSPTVIAPTPMFGPAPLPMIPYPGFGYYCVTEPMPHPAMTRPGNMVGIHPGEGAVHAVPAMPPTMPPAMAPFGYPAADVVASRSLAVVNGGDNHHSSAAQMSFPPAVTYTLAPGMTPMPGPLAGPLFAHGDGAGYIQQVSSVGRISTNHPYVSYHPYRRN